MLPLNGNFCNTKLRSIVVARVNEIASLRRNDWVLSLNAT